MVAPISRRFGIFGESAKYSDANIFSAYGGPAVGTLFDAYELIVNWSKGGISASDLHALRRLLPFQNIWQLRRAINALEGSTADAFDLKNAEHKSFIDYMGTTPMIPTNQRGGVGTGPQN